MSLNPKEISSILAKHLDELAPGEFLTNLKEFCPYLFEEDDTQNLEHHSADIDSEVLTNGTVGFTIGTDQSYNSLNTAQLESDLSSTGTNYTNAI